MAQKKNSKHGTQHGAAHKGAASEGAGIDRKLHDPVADRLIPLAPLDERNQPPGCLFEPRCPLAADDCRAAIPELTHRGDVVQGSASHEWACLHPENRSVVATAVT